MRSQRILAVTALTVGLAMPALAPPVAGQARVDWTQWGGAQRNFTSDAAGLASSWPAAGPRRLWSRALGEGHSSVLADGGRLYTMYRPLLQGRQTAQEEIVAAFDAASGKTLWEFKVAAPTARFDFSYGAGPHSTPLIAGTRLYAVTSRGELMALDKATGRQIWMHDFVKEYGVVPFGRGQSGSPLLHGGNVIVTMGGPNQAVAAFNAGTGALVWKAGAFQYAPASPILIDVDGQTQLVVFGGDVVAGMDPASGRTLWTHPHKTDWGLNISTPVWSAADRLLFLSSAYGTGSRVLELRQAGGKSSVSEKWFSNRVRVHIGTAIRLGDIVVASSGDFGPAFLTAVDVKSGKTLWQDRSFARAQLVHADGKLIVLDEDGVLGLATASPQGMKVLAKASVLTNVAWTPPTLVGTTLYVRDRRTLSAFDLGT